MHPCELLKPALTALPSYVEALEAGWSPDNIRKEVAAREQLTKIAADREAFLAALDDPQAAGDPIALPDGTSVRRLPCVVRWIWDGAFCGSIALRWQPGTSELPPHVLGHMGFSVVPWKRNRGYAKAALQMLLPYAMQLGLPYVELTVDPANLASQKVILASGGELVGRFTKPAVYGSQDALRYRIALSA